jgi:hypothetical protein
MDLFDLEDATMIGVILSDAARHQLASRR